MKSRFQSLFDADCARFIRNSTETYVRRIGFPPYAGKGIAKKLSVFS